MIRYSEYRLAMYLACPRKYYHRYIKEKRTPMAVTPYNILGGNVHLACKEFYRLNAEARTLDALHADFRSIWKRSSAREFFDSREKEKEFGEEGLRMLANFHRRFGAVKPYIMEKHMENRFNGFILYGRVDRVDISPSGALSIIDYKTNRFKELEGKDRERHTMQLKVYALLLNSKERPVETGVYYHLGEDCCDTVEFTHEKIARIHDMICELVEEIEHDTVYDPNAGKSCAYCDYHAECDSNSGVAPAEDANELDLGDGQ
ncbi:MAG: PD-(D/E)XK nuclease family protein [Spirochaetota bacterium]